MKSIDSPFQSCGVRCAGTFLLPGTDRPRSVIVMAHGFGAVRAAGLQAFAQRFVAAGHAVYLFDYRCFGDSEGTPRHWVSPRRHLQDWRAAIEHVRRVPLTKTLPLVLWGSSFSGGHVLQSAAFDRDISAVIAQVPHVSGIASMMQVPLWISLKLSLAAIFDLLGSLFGHPVYSRIVGYPGQAAAMSSEEAWDGFMRLIPSGLSWKNRVLSRVFLELPFYSPIRHVSRIQASTLVIAGQHDSLTPAACAQRAAKRIPRSEFHLLACNHFEPYVGRVFEKNIALQLDFLKRTLCGRAQPPEPQSGQ